MTSIQSEQAQQVIKFNIWSSLKSGLFGSIFRTSLVLFATLIAFVPYAWMLLTAFKQRTDIMSPNPSFFFTPTFNNFYTAFVQGGFSVYLMNSLIVAVGAVLLCMLVGVPSAYAFSRFKVFGAKHLFFFILTTRMAPGVAIAVPLYILLHKIGILGTIPGVILAHSTFTLAFVIYLMKTMFDEIPKEIDNAALTDGYSELQVFYKVILPMARPALASTALLSFMFSWNEFLFAMILGGQSGRTLPAAFPGLVTALGTYWGQLCAVSVVVTLPIIILAVILQDSLVKGLTLGAVKG